MMNYKKLSKKAALASAFILTLSGCSTLSDWSSPKNSPDLNQVTRDSTTHQSLSDKYKGRNSGSDSEINRRSLSDIKQMFAEKNVYNRKPGKRGEAEVFSSCHKVSFTAKNVPLGNILKTLAGKDRIMRVEESSGNTINLDQLVSINANNECDTDIINNLLGDLDIAHLISSSALTVMPRITKTYSLPLNRLQEGYSSSASLENVQSTTGGGGGSGSGGISSITQKSAALDEYEALKTVIEEMITNDSGSTVSINEIDGTLIANAKLSEHRKIKRMITEFTQRMVERTVVVQATVLEINKTQMSSKGVTLDILLNQIDGGLSLVSDFSSAVQGSAGTVRAYRNQGGALLYDVQAALQAKDIGFNVRVQPEMRVDNRRSAILTMGTQEEYVSNIAPGTSSANGGVAQPVPTLSVLQTGISMQVTPNVLDDGRITSHLNFVITDKVGENNFNFTGVGSFNTPIRSNRKINTRITTNDGEVVVISGLVKEQTDKQETGIPFLKDLPFIGVLFGNTTESIYQQEAVIFLTIKRQPLN